MVVAWWCPALDECPQRQAFTVELPGEIIHGLKIQNPFGPGTDVIFAVHAVMATKRVTGYTTDRVEVDIQPPRVPVQQGTNRAARKWSNNDGEWR